MSKLVPIFALAAICLVAVALAEDVYTRAVHEQDVRQPLGQLKEKPFIHLYKSYAVLSNHSEREEDDDRDYMPSADECVLFLKQYGSQPYKLRDLDEIIVLDACLGVQHNYLDEGAQEIDEERKELKEFAESPELKNLYSGTQINSLSDDGKECVANLLHNAIMAKKDYPDVVCNNHWLQVFLQFAECQVAIPAEARESDSYLKIIYEIVRERVHSCVGHIGEFMRRAYGESKFLLSPTENNHEGMWPKEVIRLLSVIQDATTDEVNMRKVQKLIRGVITQKKEFKSMLLANMAKYATKEIALMASARANRVDPSGTDRYNGLVGSLCDSFRLSSNQESEYNFVASFILLNQLLAHEDLFGISQSNFVQSVVSRTKQLGPIYLSIQACDILSFTEGALAESNSKQHYNVVFKPDTSGMILWPDVGNY